MSDEKQNDCNKVSELRVETPVGKLAARGIRISDVLALVTVAALVLLLHILIEHKQDSKNSAEVMSQMVAAQRENTCILSLSPEKREAEFFSPNGMCARMGDRRNRNSAVPVQP